MEAKDGDEGINGQLTFDLQGEGSGNFTIDSSGFVLTATPLDYEITSHYILNVTAKDGGSPPLSATAQVNITVDNVNDNVPVFETSAQVSKVREDVAIGTRVVRLNATDADGNQLNFTFSSGNEAGAFAIQLTTGLITVAAKLDREDTENYTLAVKATDLGGQSVTHNATIQVIDVNDNAPVFKQASYSKDIRENLPSGKTFFNEPTLREVLSSNKVRDRLTLKNRTATAKRISFRFAIGHYVILWSKIDCLPLSVNNIK